MVVVGNFCFVYVLQMNGELFLLGKKETTGSESKKIAQLPKVNGCFWFP